MGLERLFQAKSVAVAGASANPAKLGHTILSNLVEGGFSGPIYPINPKESSILGLEAYPSLLDIEGEVDLVVVVIPSGAVPGLVDQAVAKKVGAAIIVSGGFREAGNVKGERALVAAARAGGLRVVGPNCQGLLYTPNNLCATWPLMKRSGPIAVVSQSGTVAAAVAGWAVSDGLGVTCSLALGNKTDVNEAEAIEFLSGDGHTKAIAVYSEGLGDGRRFMGVLKRATEKVSVVLLRGGRTPVGHAAAQTHTKSLAGSYDVFASLAEANGAHVVDSIQDLYDSVKALACIEKPAPLSVASGGAERRTGNRVAIVTSSGGAGVLATDAGYESGLELARLSDKTMAALRAKLPPYCSVKNPVDLTGDATDQLYETVVRTAAPDPGIDAFLVIFGDPIPGAAEMIGRIQRDVDKPIVVVSLGGGDVEVGEGKLLAEAGIPAFSSPERAMRGFGLLVR